MHTFTRCAALAMAFLSPALCAAQAVRTNTWREVFEYGALDSNAIGGKLELINIDSTPRHLFGRCEAGAPDSVVLIGGSTDSRGEEEPFSSFPMDRVHAPISPDTLKVRVARTICGLNAAVTSYMVNSLVLEHAGRFVRMDVPSGSQRGMIWLFAEGADSRLSEIRWSPVLKRVEDVSRARTRWTAAAWRQQAISSVLSGNIYVGMTPEMVREAWGDPKTINQTTTANAHSEQWVYGSRSYVYLRNGKVYAIQQ